MNHSKTIGKMLIVLLIASFMMVPVAFGVGSINVYVDPADRHFYTDTTSIGDQFTVNVVVENTDPLDDLVGVEFKLYWDTSLLEGMTMVQPSGHIFQAAEDDGNMWVIKKQVDKVAGYAWFIVTCTDLGQGYTVGYLPLGDGIAATITLKIIAEPPWKGELSCPLELKDVDLKLADGGGSPVPRTKADGLYTYTWAYPATQPYMAVDPTLKEFLAAPFPPYTPEFDINIRVENLDADWHVVGIQFKLYYNTTLLEVKNVAEGSFMASFGSTWYVEHVELDYVYVFVVLNGPYPPTEYPHGSGVFATITFQGIYAEEFPWIGESDLMLDEVEFVDDTPAYVEPAASVDGLYRIEGFILGRQLDLYTCNYPEGYNGIGPNKPADAFAPQDWVCLCAYLTYNLDPVQNKIVSFEVHSPYDDHIVYLTGITNETGYACVGFRIPWPCPEWPEDEIFGIWEVTATADVANEVVIDTMQFRVGWLVELVSVESTYENYFKGNHTEWKITYKTISAQYRNVTFTLLLQDELGVPIGYLTIVDFSVGGAPLLGEIEDFEFMVCLEIPKWAYIGTATAHVNAYTTFPSLGGTAYCPEVTTTVRIVRP